MIHLPELPETEKREAPKLIPSTSREAMGIRFALARAMAYAPDGSQESMTARFQDARLQVYGDESEPEVAASH